MSRALKLAREVVSCNGCTWLETRKLRPLGNDPGLAISHLPLRSHPAPRCPPCSERLIFRDCVHRLPGPLPRLGSCPWEAPMGHQGVGELRVGHPLPQGLPCRAAGNSLWSLMCSRRQHLWARTRGYCPGYCVFLCGFPSLSQVPFSIVSSVNSQLPHLSGPCVSSWDPE